MSMRDVFYKDVEKQILTLRDSKSVTELEGIVNEYLDDTIARVRRQIPDLSQSDLNIPDSLIGGAQIC